MKKFPFNLADQHQDKLLPSVAHMPDITKRIRTAEKAEEDRQKIK